MGRVSKAKAQTTRGKILKSAVLRTHGWEAFQRRNLRRPQVSTAVSNTHGKKIIKGEFSDDQRETLSHRVIGEGVAVRAFEVRVKANLHLVDTHRKQVVPGRNNTC